MATVLMTAFEPYDRWKANSSWLTLVELTRQLPQRPKLTTRLYPVDFAVARDRLQKDLAAGYDFVLHLGQAPGASRMRLEAIGLNVAGRSHLSPDDFRPLITDGPVAYRSALPLPHWAQKLRAAGIPAQVSYHAGEYLCNALLYLTHYFADRQGLTTRAAFIHLPLAPSQVLGDRDEIPTFPTSMGASGLRLILDELEQLAAER